MRETVLGKRLVIHSDSSFHWDGIPRGWGAEIHISVLFPDLPTLPRYLFVKMGNDFERIFPTNVFFFPSFIQDSWEIDAARTAFNKVKCLHIVLPISFFLGGGAGGS